MKMRNGFDAEAGQFYYTVADGHGEPEAWVRIPAPVLLEQIERHIDLRIHIDGCSIVWQVWCAGTRVNVDAWDVQRIYNVVHDSLRRTHYQSEDDYAEHLNLLAKDLRESAAIVYEQRLKRGLVKPIHELVKETAGV